MAGLIKRGDIYYAVYRMNGKEKRKSLETDDLRIAKAKIRKLEDDLDRGIDTPFPTKTPIPTVLEAFIQHMFSRRIKSSVEKDLSPMRQMFGQVCPSLMTKSRKGQKIAERIATKATMLGIKKRHVSPIEAICFESITKRQLNDWLDSYSDANSLEPKTSNRYREVLKKLFNWSIKKYGLRFPGGKNPTDDIDRWKEGAPIINYLTIEQIDQQLAALRNHHILLFKNRILSSDIKLKEIEYQLAATCSPVVKNRLEDEKRKRMALHHEFSLELSKPSQMEIMVAVYIYAGLRREEGMWLRIEDVDLKSGYIRIRAKELDGVKWEPKNKKNRVVPISRNLMKILESYEPRNNKENLYFLSPEGCFWNLDNFSTDLAAINKSYGLSWGCDEYRHTFGSQLAQKGVSLYKISTMMGNSPEICRRHYAAVIPESLKDSVDFCEDVRVDFTEPESPEHVLNTTGSAKRTQLRLVVNK